MFIFTNENQSRRLAQLQLSFWDSLAFLQHQLYWKVVEVQLELEIIIPRRVLIEKYHGYNIVDVIHKKW